MGLKRLSSRRAPKAVGGHEPMQKCCPSKRVPIEKGPLEIDPRITSLWHGLPAARQPVPRFAAAPFWTPNPKPNSSPPVFVGEAANVLKLCKKYMPETKVAKKQRLMEMAQQKKDGQEVKTKKPQADFFLFPEGILRGNSCGWLGRNSYAFPQLVGWLQKSLGKFGNLYGCAGLHPKESVGCTDSEAFPMKTGGSRYASEGENKQRQQTLPKTIVATHAVGMCGA